MAILRWVLVALMAVIAAASLAHSFDLWATDSESVASGQYYCPMHPQIVQDGPGDCPICNMTLVPKDEGRDGAATEGKAAAAETGSEPAVPGLVPLELSLERTQLIGVQTAPATTEALTPELLTVGYVTADEARLVRVQTRFAGWIERLFVATTGEKVRRGQLLASIFSPELLPAQQEFLAARRWSQAGSGALAPETLRTENGPVMASQLEQAARTRLELLGLSKQEIDAIAATAKVTRTVQVTAPISGTVMLKNAIQGAAIQPGTELYEIVDLSEVWVLAEINEHELGRVALGQSAEVEFGAYPGKLFAGKVGFIFPSVDPETRRLRVRVELGNSEGQLRPGMYGNVKIQLRGAEGVVIPRQALVDTGDHQYVFLAREAGRFEPRSVTVGARSGDKVQILTGLSPGDVVVTTGNFLIDSESRLRAAISGPAH
jgi:Cu(I)/Ag(I) efflux system membrane fusion protein